MRDLFDDLVVKDVPIPRPKSRLILIADEIGDGAFAVDLSAAGMHPAKVAMIALNLFKSASAAVADEMERREILNQFNEIANIVTGKVNSEAAPILSKADLQLCQHDYSKDAGLLRPVCSKCGKLEPEKE